MFVIRMLFMLRHNLYTCKNSPLRIFSAAVYTNPLYVTSPYGNWLTEQDNPVSSFMSDWFREKTGTNIMIEGNFILEWQAGDGVHRLVL